MEEEESASVASPSEGEMSDIASLPLYDRT